MTSLRPAAWICLTFMLQSCGPDSGPQPAAASPPAPKPAAPPTVVSKEEGTATWYKVPDGSLAKRRGPDSGLTAAHRDLPIGTEVRVTNEENHQSVEVEITDRGIGRDPVIDVSKVAAAELGIVKEGEAPVLVEVLEKTPAPGNSPAR